MSSGTHAMLALQRLAGNRATAAVVNPVVGRSKPALVPRGTMVVQRSLGKLKPEMGNRRWQALATLVDGYNSAPVGQAKLLKLDLVAEAAERFAQAGLLARLGSGAARTRAAKALVNQIRSERSTLQRDLVLNQDLMLKQAKTATANEDWIVKQARANIDARKDKKVGRLDLGALKGAIKGADYEAVADLFTQGRDETKSSEELIEFQGRTGEAESNLGFMKRRGQLVVSVNVPFTGAAGHDGKIQAAIDQHWNTFQAEYKGAKTTGYREIKGAKDKLIKVKVTEAPPPATGTVDIIFKVGASSATTTKSGAEPIAASHKAAGTGAKINERFAVKKVAPVFLWTGDHPDWKKRAHLGTGAKTRSDAGNWRMNDAGVDRMVAHEFGHLIGLIDEYSQTHSDIAKTTGKTSKKYDVDDKGNVKLKAGDQVSYDRVVGAFKSAAAKPEAVADISNELKGLYADPERFAFLSAHFYEHDAQTLVGAKRHFATALADFAKWHEPKAKAKAQQLQGTAVDWKAANLVDQDKRTVKQKSLLLGVGNSDPAQKAKDALALAQQLNVLADPASYDVNWMWYSSAGFRSGGLMGDYTTIDSGAEDTRYNAIAHDHKHPLEPRHVKRFVDMLGAARGEKWEAKYKG